MSRQNCRYFFCRYFSYNKTNHLARDMRSYACAYIYSEHSSDILKKSSLQAHTIFTDLLLLCCSLWRGPQRVCAAAHGLLLPPHRRHAAFVPLLCCESGPGEYTVEFFNFYILILWWKHNIRSRQRSQITPLNLNNLSAHWNWDLWLAKIIKSHHQWWYLNTSQFQA